MFELINCIDECSVIPYLMVYMCIHVEAGSMDPVVWTKQGTYIRKY
jgi:hypothetical protein